MSLLSREMDVFENPDLLSQVLSFTGRLPRYASVNRDFYEASQILVQEQIEYMNRNYPLWNITRRDLGKVSRGARIIQQQEMQIDNIIFYHLQRAAINRDWDVFRAIVEHRHRTDASGAPNLVGNAMYIAHLNGNTDLATLLYRLYGKEIYSINSKGYSSIITYYVLQENPSLIDNLNRVNRVNMYQTELISPALREYARNNPLLRQKLQSRQDYFVISGVIPSDEELRQFTSGTFNRAMLRYRAAHPDIPYDLLLFTFKSDVIDQTADQILKNILYTGWMLLMSTEVSFIKFYTIRMIQELDRLLDDPNFPGLSNPRQLVEKPILLKGSQAVWNIFSEMETSQKKVILEPFAMRIAYFQRQRQPVTLSSLLLNQP